MPGDKLRGTVQNDILKEYIARGNYIFPPRPSMRITTDLFAYCAERLPLFNTISISGYHIREAGSTAVQELAFTIANGIAYCEAAVAAGLSPDEFGERVSFFFNAHNDFLQEVAKFRAARRLWARVMRSGSAPRTRGALALRFHAQTGGSTLTAQQPELNIVRVADPGARGRLRRRPVAAHELVRRGARAADRARGEDRAAHAAGAAHEVGTTPTADPLGGSYAVEALTRELEHARELIERIDELGGAVAAVEQGFVQHEIEEAAFRFAGTSSGASASWSASTATWTRGAGRSSSSASIPRSSAGSSSARARVRAERDPEAASRALAEVRSVAEGTGNLLVPMREALRALHDRRDLRRAANRLRHLRRAAACGMRRAPVAVAVAARCSCRSSRSPHRAAMRPRAAAAPSFQRTSRRSSARSAPGAIRSAASRRSRSRRRSRHRSGRRRSARPWTRRSCRPGRRARPRRVRRRGDEATDGAAAVDARALGEGGWKASGPSSASRRPPSPTFAPASACSRSRCRRRTTRRRRRRHRRLPLLPARPEALGGRVRDVREHPPGRRSIVHHVILFRIPATARARGEGSTPRPPGAGWSCFGGIGVSGRAAGARERAVDLGLGPGLGLGPPPGRHRRLDAEGQPRRDAGALQPRQRHAPDRSRAVFTLAPPAGLEGDGDGAAAGAGGARVRQGREGTPLQPRCGARRPRQEVRLARRRRAGRAAVLLRQGRGEPEGVDDLDVQPHDFATDDDPPRRPGTCTCSASRSASSSTPARRRKVLLDIPRWDFHWQNALRSRPGRGEARRRRPCDVPLRAHAAPSRRARDPADAPLRALGRGHDGRDVPRHRAGHARLAPRLCESSSSHRCTRGPRTRTSASSCRGSSTLSRPGPRDRAGGRRPAPAASAATSSSPGEARRAARAFRPDVVYAHFLVPAGLVAAQRHGRRSSSPRMVRTWQTRLERGRSAARRAGSAGARPPWSPSRATCATSSSAPFPRRAARPRSSTAASTSSASLSSRHRTASVVPLRRLADRAEERRAARRRLRAAGGGEATLTSSATGRCGPGLEGRRGVRLVGAVPNSQVESTSPPRESSANRASWSRSARRCSRRWPWAGRSWRRRSAARPSS